MNTIGLGNALVDVLLRLENDDVLSEIGIQKGAMDMINREQMIAIRTTLAGLPRTQTPGGSVCNTMRSMSSLGANSGFIGKIGDDSIGGFYEDALEKAVDREHREARVVVQNTGAGGTGAPADLGFVESRFTAEQRHIPALLAGCQSVDFL
mgnify:CR=1 FL=1